MDGVFGNYEKWKCARIRNPNGFARTSVLTKKTVTSMISVYLEKVNTKKSLEEVMSKMR